MAILYFSTSRLASNLKYSIAKALNVQVVKKQPSDRYGGNRYSDRYGMENRQQVRYHERFRRQNQDYDAGHYPDFNGQR